MTEVLLDRFCEKGIWCSFENNKSEYNNTEEKSVLFYARGIKDAIGAAYVTHQISIPCQVLSSSIFFSIPDTSYINRNLAVSRKSDEKEFKIIQPGTPDIKPADIPLTLEQAGFTFALIHSVLLLQPTTRRDIDESFLDRYERKVRQKKAIQTYKEVMGIISRVVTGSDLGETKYDNGQWVTPTTRILQQTVTGPRSY